MRLLTTALVSGLLLAAAGCGDGRQPESPPQAGQYDGCTMDNVERTGRVVATLHGTGDTVRLRLVPAGSPRCPSSLVARTGGGVTGSSVRGLGLDLSTARVVRAGGQDLLAVVSRGTGGTRQTHLFGPGARELEVRGDPLLPAVVAGDRTPVDARCTRRGIAVDTATAHQPPGIVLAWDVTRTTYAVRGGAVQVLGQRSLVTAAADPVLRKSRRELYDGRLLVGC